MDARSFAKDFALVLWSGLSLSLAAGNLTGAEAYQWHLPVIGIVVQPDQKILVAHHSDHLFCLDERTGTISICAGGLQRFEPDGSLDRSFQSRMCALTGLRLRGDGHILVEGALPGQTPPRNGGIAMLLPNGAVDDSFVPFRNLSNGIPAQPLNWWPFASLYRAALESNGCIVMPPLNDPGIPAAPFARFDPTGKLLLPPAREFPLLLRGVNGLLVVDREPTEVAREIFESFPLELFRYAFRLPDGGAVMLVRGRTGHHVWRFDRNWRRDERFDSAIQFDGTKMAQVCFALQPDGKLLMAGNATQLNGEPFPGVARLEQNGASDPTFRCRTDGEAAAIAIQSDGHILLGGFFKRVNDQDCRYFARLNSDGTLDPDLQSRVISTEDLGARWRVRIVRMSPPPPKLLTPETLELPPAIVISSLNFNPGGAAVLRFTGDPGQVYILQARNQLGEGAWTTIRTNTTDVRGNGVFEDPAAGNLPMRFYRVAVP